MLEYVKYDNEVMELYRKFNLITKKIIVLRVEKQTLDFSDWIDAELLQPTLIIEHFKGYYIGWAINGTIKTKEQKKFYKDLSLRLKKTMLKKTKLNIVENSSIWALKYIKEDGIKIITKTSYEMKTLAKSCLSLTTKEEKEKKLANTTTKEEFQIFAGTYKKSDDALFDFIRYKAYDYKKINIINEIDTKLEDLENYCQAIGEIGYKIIGGKDISTTKIKAKHIAKWVYENFRERKQLNNKELEMTRKENIIRINKLRAEDRKLKVKQAIQSLKFLGERISVRKVAEYANISTKTAQKYLKQARETGLV